MDAQDYSTKNAKTPEEVFTLYHAWNSGYQAREDKGFGGVIFLGVLMGMMFTLIVLLIVHYAITPVFVH